MNNHNYQIPVPARLLALMRIVFALVFLTLSAQLNAASESSAPFEPEAPGDSGGEPVSGSGTDDDPYIMPPLDVNGNDPAPGTGSGTDDDPYIMEPFVVTADPNDVDDLDIDLPDVGNGILSGGTGGGGGGAGGTGGGGGPTSPSNTPRGESDNCGLTASDSPIKTDAQYPGYTRQTRTISSPEANNMENGKDANGDYKIELATGGVITGVYIQEITYTANMTNPDGSVATAEIKNADDGTSLGFIQGDQSYTFYEAYQATTANGGVFQDTWGTPTWSSGATGTFTVNGSVKFYPGLTYDDLTDMSPDGATMPGTNIHPAGFLPSSNEAPEVWSEGDECGCSDPGEAGAKGEMTVTVDEKGKTTPDKKPEQPGTCK